MQEECYISSVVSIVPWRVEMTTSHTTRSVRRRVRMLVWRRVPWVVVDFPSLTASRLYLSRDVRILTMKFLRNSGQSLSTWFRAQSIDFVSPHVHCHLSWYLVISRRLNYVQFLTDILRPFQLFIDFELFVPYHLFCTSFEHVISKECDSCHIVSEYLFRNDTRMHLKNIPWARHTRRSVSHHRRLTPTILCQYLLIVFPYQLQSSCSKLLQFS